MSLSNLNLCWFSLSSLTVNPTYIHIIHSKIKHIYNNKSIVTITNHLCHICICLSTSETAVIQNYSTFLHMPGDIYLKAVKEQSCQPLQNIKLRQVSWHCVQFNSFILEAGRSKRKKKKKMAVEVVGGGYRVSLVEVNCQVLYIMS